MSLVKFKRGTKKYYIIASRYHELGELQYQLVDAVTGKLFQYNSYYYDRDWVYSDRLIFINDCGDNVLKEWFHRGDTVRFKGCNTKYRVIGFEGFGTGRVLIRREGKYSLSKVLSVHNSKITRTSGR